MMLPASTRGDDPTVRLLVAQYLQVVEAHNVSIPPGYVLLKPDVQDYIYQHMFNETNIWPLPPTGYRIRILKMLLAKMEESMSDPDEDEISDDLMGYLGSLLSVPHESPLEQAQKLSYVSYTVPGRLGHEVGASVITWENRGLILSSGTTGFRTWEAALHLATYLATPKGKSLIQGMDVIELGSGTGLLSLYCLKYLGANSVMATDRDPALLSNIQDCVVQNNLDPARIKTGIWEWGNPFSQDGDSSGKSIQSFDVALGADLIYDVDLVPLLIPTLQDLFDNYKIKHFVISATLRNPKTFSAFFEACGESNLNAHELEFESPPRESQDGLFHSTDVPIRTYIISPSRL
ncbi:hypothetical protein AJ80_05028 [Polytolypa hystricis UAMH7299]|uniref:FAM86 N-terminal domain-containing protein n=1 Tax=Polytolypa hystricis (strain UAMH7299) TaxID=1447883 RepID=A0A2B7Y6X8_POLH7|nr:hypothetical protein AJ80_05028 [Polytolypa hystricis UAMH7299]